MLNPVCYPSYKLQIGAIMGKLPSRNIQIKDARIDYVMANATDTLKIPRTKYESILYR